MSLFGAFKRKSDASVNIEPAYEPETEAKGELDFVNGQAETAEEVIQAHLEEEARAQEEAKLAEAQKKAAEEAAKANETAADSAAEPEKTPAIVVPEYVPPKNLLDELEEETIPESEKICQKIPVTQHEPVINLPEFHPSDEPAIALIRGDEGFLAKDLVSGMMAVGNCEDDAKDRLMTLLAQPA
ncbi:MAG: hypothetical protein IKN07_01605 [Lachnospiraceae bacterium]|nr:hypothetical protein [Lachnospiraceae bacterium]